MAPIRATAVLDLVVHPEDAKGSDRWLLKRRDRWEATLLSTTRAHILHEVDAKLVDRPDQRQRREALLDGERMATRTGGDVFLLRPTHATWAEWLRRPRREFEALLEAVGCKGIEASGTHRDAFGRVADGYEGVGPLGKVSLLVEPSSRVVLAASVELRDPARSVRFHYSLGRKDATLSIPDFAAEEPERQRSLRDREELLKGLTK